MHAAWQTLLSDTSPVSVTVLWQSVENTVSGFSADAWLRARDTYDVARQTDRRDVALGTLRAPKPRRMTVPGAWAPSSSHWSLTGGFYFHRHDESRLN